jgi:hypothetical protein
MNIANLAFHAINQATQPVQPTLEELLAELNADLEDAKARYYCAQMTGDQYRWEQSHVVWLPRIAAIKKQIKLIEEGI